jgi:hypothetical protein
MFYPPTQGFGQGLAVGASGLVFRFTAAVREVIMYNTGNSDMYVGCNSLISGVGSDNYGATDSSVQWGTNVPTITKEQAIATGVLVKHGDSLTLESSDPMAGERNIYCVWAITAGSDTTTLQGGSISV